MRNKFWMWMEVLMLLIWVVTLIVFLWQIRSEGTVCKANPLVYGVDKLEKENNSTFTCACKFENEPEYEIFVTSKEWELKSLTIPTEPSYQSFDFNLSILQ